MHLISSRVIFLGRWGSFFCKLVMVICSSLAIISLMCVYACVMVIGVVLCVGRVVVSALIFF